MVLLDNPSPLYQASWEPAMAVLILEQAKLRESKPFIVGLVGYVSAYHLLVVGMILIS
jgi:hypothetical protein